MKKKSPYVELKSSLDLTKEIVDLEGADFSEVLGQSPMSRDLRRE